MYIYRRYGEVVKPYPGQVLSKAIELLLGKAVKGCFRCRRQASQMNEWGWWGCWKQRKLIAGWISNEARRFGHNLDESAALTLLGKTIKSFNS